MKTTNAIRDGQTIAGYIVPVEGLHQGLRFDFRPMLAEEFEQTEFEVAHVGTTDPAAAIQMIADRVAEKLESWSEVDDKGGALAPVYENVRRLCHPLLTRLYRIVSKQDPTDKPPGELPDETQERIDQLRRRAAGSTLIAEEKAAAKNSDGG